MEDYGEWIWDEAEYNFFMSLGDIAKLEYMYDFFNLDDDSIEGEFDLLDEDDKPSTTSIDVIITDTHFVITCDDESIVKKTIATFKMDGYILMYERTRGHSRYYKYVGMTHPSSVNWQRVIKDTNGIYVVYLKEHYV